MRRRGADLLLLLALASVPARAADPAPAADAEKSAEAAARAWLTLVDAGQYGESWDAAASLFRSALSRDQWRAALDRVRRPLGRVSSRKLLGAKFATELPNAPKGEYVVIRFATDFEHETGAVETITPTKERDGTWRVSGYFVK
ncbi:MAG TPA: DUF4019 domain-containing protein [Thermoanaerobaculia bacterium]|nr:DUF4019 domain-containing protein [Thermoanaerobaculia bacterium]